MANLVSKDNASGSKTATTEWFASDLLMSENLGFFRITLSISASAIIEVTLDSGSNWTALNSGIALVADQIYTFEVPVRNGDTINFRTPSGATTTTVDIGRIDQVSGA